jgi:hypothetical protein
LLSPRHALASTHTEQVDLEFGEGGQDVEEHLAHGVFGVVNLPAEGELDAAGGEIVADSPSVGYRARETVEFRDHECVAFSHGGEGLVEARAGTGGAGQAVIEIDPPAGHAEFGQSLALGSEVLGIGAASGVSDEVFGHSYAV